jgi:hypothetical protein
MRIRLNYLTPVLAAGAAAVAIAAAPTAAADPTPAQPRGSPMSCRLVMEAAVTAVGAAIAAVGAAIAAVGAAIAAVGAAIAAVGAGVGAGADTGSGQCRRKRLNQREDPCPASI